MEFLLDLTPQWHATVYNFVLFGLCLIIVFRNINADGNTIIYNPTTPPIPAIILTIALIVFIGLRSEDYYQFFGDSNMYKHSFENVATDWTEMSFSQEWLFNNMMYGCKLLGFPISTFFLIVAFVYYGLMLVCCWRLFPNNTWIAVLFFFASFSCYGYGVNGIRNGMATSLILVAVTLLAEGGITKWLSLIFVLLAFSTHRSTALPGIAAIASYFVIKEPRQAIGFWLASIVISLLFGNAVGDFFAGLGFDDRMDSYFVEGQEDLEQMERFTSTGFRFDFLLYSAMPVLMTWYVTVKRNFRDRTFNLIANTYILSNAFWIMVIRAAYSNRFAYLSWFIYPLVIAYPLLRMKIWDDQDKKTAQILLAYAGFTFFMYFISKYGPIR